MKNKQKIIQIILLVLSAALILTLWQTRVIHSILSLKKYQLPVPSEIGKALVENQFVIRKNTLYTVIEALSGLAIGTVIGMFTAIVSTALKKIGGGIITIAAALNAVPMVAMAPIMNNWFGMAMGSKIAVVAFFVSSIMSVNVYKGLNTQKPFELDLMKTYAADKKTVFLKCRIPSSIPALLTGLKLSSSAALVTAICSEFFSSFAGIGFDMSTAIKQSKMSLAWAYILAAAICGIILYLIIGLIEKKVLHWHTSQR